MEKKMEQDMETRVLWRLLYAVYRAIMMVSFQAAAIIGPAFALGLEVCYNALWGRLFRIRCSDVRSARICCEFWALKR